jgi:hypothetical protein
MGYAAPCAASPILRRNALAKDPSLGGTILALAAAIVICLAGWALTAPLLIHLVGTFDKPYSPGDPEGLGYIVYSIGAMILAVPVWIWLAYRAYRLIKRRRPAGKPRGPLGNPQ